jgi:hypothetical protein
MAADPQAVVAVILLMVAIVSVLIGCAGGDDT